MGGIRAVLAVIFLSTAALIAGTGALAATPQEIYRDYADNGRLDGNYSPADLDKALKSAAVQQYGQPSTGGLEPEAEEASGGGTAGGVAGGGTQGGQPGGGAAPVTSSGGLPFTGLDLTLMVAGALGFILLGAALRRAARQRA
jgi:hypothetical protein